MNSMIDMSIRIRSVSMNDRGQIVIPEDVRKDLNLEPKETLVLIERNNEILLRKESSVAKSIVKEDEFWGKVSKESLKGAWGKEDKIWDKIAAEKQKNSPNRNHQRMDKKNKK